MLRYIIVLKDKNNNNVYLSKKDEPSFNQILDFSFDIKDALQFSTEDYAEEFYIRNEENIVKLMEEYNYLKIDFPEINRICT